MRIIKYQNKWNYPRDARLVQHLKINYYLSQQQAKKEKSQVCWFMHVISALGRH
jgi:hypothetical protein